VGGYRLVAVVVGGYRLVAVVIGGYRLVAVETATKLCLAHVIDARERRSPTIDARAASRGWRDG
jgi:hypothetical protein